MPIRPEQKALYPKDWKAISLRIRKDRAEDRCEQMIDGLRCEAVNGIAHPDTGSRVVLTVAHLNHQPQDVDEANLRAMCQRCHLSYDREHHRQTRQNRLGVAELFGAPHG